MIFSHINVRSLSFFLSFYYRINYKDIHGLKINPVYRLVLLYNISAVAGPRKQKNRLPYSNEIVKFTF